MDLTSLTFEFCKKKYVELCFLITFIFLFLTDSNENGNKTQTFLSFLRQTI